MFTIKRPKTVEQWDLEYKALLKDLDKIEIPEIPEVDDDGLIEIRTINRKLLETEKIRRELNRIEMNIEILNAVMERWHDLNEAKLISNARQKIDIDGKQVYPNVTDRKAYATERNTEFAERLEATVLLTDAIALERKRLSGVRRTLQSVGDNVRHLDREATYGSRY